MYSGLGSPNSDSSTPPPSYSPSDTPATPSSEPNLHQLRGQIKKVMIPLLIKIFELKLAAQQAKTPPSRLQKKIHESPEEIQNQLDQIESDIKLLHLWCISCQKQIEKARKEAEEIGKPPQLHTASSEKTANPAIEKSFSEAVRTVTREDSPSPGWLRKFLQN
jgi:TolA-binding protein